MTITEIASELKLAYTRSNSHMLIEEANQLQITYEDFLLRLLEGTRTA